MATIILLNGRKIKTEADIVKIQQLLHTDKKFIEVKEIKVLEGKDNHTINDFSDILIFINNIVTIE